MCGHGTIGTVTTAINLGIIECKEIIKLDTPVGIVECRVEYSNKTVKRVTFKNVPSFVLQQNARVNVRGIGEVVLDIAFGGSIFAIVDADQFGLHLVPDEQQELISLGMAIKEAANKQLSLQHPLIPDINTIDLIEFSLPSNKQDVDYRNTVVFGNGQIDRSPCGTGTCAKMAVLHSKGKLNVNEPFVNESIIDSRFVGRIVDTQNIEQYIGIVPEITGSAWITGMHQFVIEKEDPFNEGFLIV